MKIKPFIEINLGDRWYVLPKNRQAKNCIVELNDTGHFFLSELSSSDQLELIVEKALVKYNLAEKSRSHVTDDLLKFINDFKASGLITSDDRSSD